MITFEINFAYSFFFEGLIFLSDNLQKLFIIAKSHTVHQKNFQICDYATFHDIVL